MYVQHLIILHFIYHHVFTAYNLRIVNFEVVIRHESKHNSSFIFHHHRATLNSRDDAYLTYMIEKLKAKALLIRIKIIFGVAKLNVTKPMEISSENFF